VLLHEETRRASDMTDGMLDYRLRQPRPRGGGFTEST
jgi:hypothetical protein